FAAEARDLFWNSRFTVSAECDRMGARLKGPKIEAADGGNIMSEGVAFGAVQVPGAGSPIIMLADHQTTGGYAKIAQVISADFRLIGQLRAGDTLRFRAVSPDEAREAYLWERRQLRELRIRLDALNG
ncbi:MAG: KipI antagonist, partial [Clostridia bacterium]|nr:KipI antagonist [Clostridia bacterium]